MSHMRPTHYRGKTLEVIDVIRDFDLDFEIGNVVKYVLRAGKKPGEEERKDLEKALQYLCFRLGLPNPAEARAMRDACEAAERCARQNDRFNHREELVLALKAAGFGEFLT